MHCSPLNPFYEQAEALFMGFGDAIRMPAEVERVEPEYAAIRKAAALVDSPHRALIRLTGGDRADFLHRLLTADVNAMKPGDVRRAFLLTSQGRILADMLVIHRDDATYLDTDAPTAPALAAELDKVLFGEDVRIEDMTDAMHRVSLHGPAGERAVAWWVEQSGGGDAVVYARDETGAPGYHIWAPPDTVPVWGEQREQLRESLGLRHAGWSAYNIARIEAGRPLFRIDFGPDTLPHETGRRVLEEAVCFTAGCYRGQEIVARMESRAQQAKTLVLWRMVDGRMTSPADPTPPMPVAGVPLIDPADTDADAVGAVTSSTHAPLLSQCPVGIAMVKWGFHEPGTRLTAPAEGGRVTVEVASEPVV